MYWQGTLSLIILMKDSRVQFSCWATKKVKWPKTTSTSFQISLHPERPSPAPLSPRSTSTQAAKTTKKSYNKSQRSTQDSPSISSKLPSLSRGLLTNSLTLLKHINKLPANLMLNVLFTQLPCLFFLIRLHWALTSLEVFVSLWPRMTGPSLLNISVLIMPLLLLLGDDTFWSILIQKSRCHSSLACLWISNLQLKFNFIKKLE